MNENNTHTLPGKLKRRIFNAISLLHEPNRSAIKKMYRFLMENYADAKGSSNNHQNWTGGYFNHIADVCEFAIDFYHPFEFYGELNFELKDALTVLLLHDIEKPFKYAGNAPKIQVETQAEILEKVIKTHNLELTDDQMNALRYIHGEGDDYSGSKRVMKPLAAFCHICDVMSARIFFDRDKPV